MPSSERLQDLQRRQADHEYRLQQLLQQHMQNQKCTQQEPCPQKHKGSQLHLQQQMGIVESVDRQAPRPPLQQRHEQPDYNIAPTVHSHVEEWQISSSHIEPEGDQFSCVLVKDNNVSKQNIGLLKPPSLSGGTDPLPASTALQCPMDNRAEQVDRVKRLILSGTLHVSVFNNELVLEPKTLALHPGSRRLSVLRSDGLCEDAWDMEYLSCITKGIVPAVLTEPPPADRSMAFRFKFKVLDEEDRFLCIVFDTAETMQYAAAAFGELCSVPITTAA